LLGFFVVVFVFYFLRCLFNLSNTFEKRPLLNFKSFKVSR